MNVVLIGGTFTNDPNAKKGSGVVGKMYVALAKTNAVSHCLRIPLVINGGNESELEKLAETPIEFDADVTIWMPNVTNEEAKHYPHKKQGSVLICSKVMREGYTRVDSVSRIFKMHGNAVIEIRKNEETGRFNFTLVDALANVWYDGSDIDILMVSIMSFVAFTKSACRINTKRCDEAYVDMDGYFNNNKENLEKLLEINKKLQNHIQTSCGNRFFGNVSTRCQKLFPTARTIQGNTMYVSPRNSNKESLTPEDMVLYFGEYDTYCGEVKPSVDSPAQIRLYHKMPNINFMIHGHANILDIDVPSTKHYKLCGDINEVDEILEVVNNLTPSFIVNLTGHGFLIGAGTAEILEDIVENKLIKEATFKITNQ